MYFIIVFVEVILFLAMDVAQWLCVDEKSTERLA